MLVAQISLFVEWWNEQARHHAQMITYLVAHEQVDKFCKHSRILLSLCLVTSSVWNVEVLPRVEDPQEVKV